MDEQEAPLPVEPIDEGGEVGSDSTRHPHRSALYKQVSKQLNSLQESYLRDAPWAVRALAKLRHGIGKAPGDIPELAQWTTPDLYTADYFSDEITSEEQAAYVAVTLYAMHQQGRREIQMHRPNQSLGEAVRKLRYSLGVNGEAGVLSRFNAIGTATDFPELVRHARGLIQQLRAEGIWLDYALFADDLRKLMVPETAAGVRNRWGRHFHRAQRSSDTVPAAKSPASGRNAAAEQL